MNKHKDAPFAIVGVNSDRDRSKIQRLVREKQLSWRSFWNNGTGGAISRKWNIYSWPTIFVIDHRGIIRFKQVRGEELDRAVEMLLAEASKASPGK